MLGGQPTGPGWPSVFFTVMAESRIFEADFCLFFLEPVIGSFFSDFRLTFKDFSLNLFKILSILSILFTDDIVNKTVYFLKRFSVLVKSMFFLFPVSKLLVFKCSTG